MTTNYNPATSSSAYLRMEARRVLPRLLMGGTHALRAAWEKYVPRLQGEAQEEWEARASYVRLLPAYAEAVERCAAQVFKRPILLNDDVPPPFMGKTATDGTIDREGWWWNIDLRGTAGSDFCAAVFRDMWHEALPMVLVSNTGKGLPSDPSRAGTKDRRPFFVHYRPSQIRRVVPRIVDNKVVKGRIHVAEPVIDPVWGEEDGERIMVLYRAGEEPIPGGALGFSGALARFEYWRKAPKNAKEPWVLSGVPGEEPGEFAPHTEIPAVLFPGPRAISPWEAYPWFEELAYLNHYHAIARNGLEVFLQFITTAILELAGYDKDKVGDNIVSAGGGKIIINGRPATETRVEVKETSGSAATVAKGDLRDIEEAMRSMGMRPILDQVPRTLGQAVLDQSESESILQQSARQLKDGIEQCLMYAAAYIGEVSGGSVDVNMQYSLDAQAGTKLEAALKAREGRDGEPDLSRLTLWEIMRSHGALMEDFDAKVEEQRLADEARAKAEVEADTQEARDRAFGVPVVTPASMPPRPEMMDDTDPQEADA